MIGSRFFTRCRTLFPLSEDQFRYYTVFILLLLLGPLPPVRGQHILPEEIPLPVAVGQPQLDPNVQRELSEQPPWRAFVRRHGPWAVQWNEFTETPHRAYGPPIAIPGYREINTDNVEAAARKFITEHLYHFFSRPPELYLKYAHMRGHIWYVGFSVQAWQEHEVLLSEIELRINRNAGVAAFGLDVYPDIPLGLGADLSVDAVRAVVAGRLPAAEKVSINVDREIFILPVRDEKKITWYPVYRVWASARQPAVDYLAFVDGRDGAVRWSMNLGRTLGEAVDTVAAPTHVAFSGEIHPEFHTDSLEARPFADQFVTIQGTVFVTDSLGRAGYPLATPAVVSASLQGPWVSMVHESNLPIGETVMVLFPGDSIPVLWEDGNSAASARDVFYHVNHAFRYVRRLDAGLETILPPITCVVESNLFCNAGWMSNEILFGAAGGSCPNTGMMPSIIYHEFAHHVNSNLYRFLRGLPMLNKAGDEGLADVLAAMLQDRPEIAVGLFAPGEPLRNLDNTLRFPYDLTNSWHFNGQILGGAFWDLRELTSTDLVQRLSHFAKYGLPDDPTNGVLFSEWFVETLLADDDDGDLSNGTPHSPQIVAAFNNHDIGSNLFFRLSFEHVPLADTPNTDVPYIVQCFVGAQNAINHQPDSVVVDYTTDNYATRRRVVAWEQNPGHYRADIPPSPAGTVLRYTIRIYESLGETVTIYPEEGDFAFAIGFHSQMLDDLETAAGWTVGAADDDATAGEWEHGKPFWQFYFGSTVQPGWDHSPGGERCFVTTAQNGGQANNFDVDGGKTTLFTPVYDLSALTIPLIRFWRWFHNRYGDTSQQDIWRVDLSDDGGLTWMPIDEVLHFSQVWEKTYIRLPDYTDRFDAVQLRFVVSDYNDDSLIEGLVDDLEILAVDPLLTGFPGDVPGNSPRAFSLEQNYPNPFNPETVIRYQLSVISEVDLAIYNSLGQRIKTLVAGRQRAGRYTLRWNGQDFHGRPVSSGVYIYRLQALPQDGAGEAPFRRARKLVLLR